MTHQYTFYPGGGRYADCMWWEISAELKFSYESDVDSINP